MMKTALSLSLASFAAAEEDCLADASVLLQVTKTEGHMTAGMVLDLEDHGVIECDAWCQIDQHKQSECEWNKVASGKDHARFCEWSDPAFVEFPWDGMEKEHRFCIDEHSCTENWTNHPEHDDNWMPVAHDPVQQCLDEAWYQAHCVGDFWCEMSRKCEHIWEADFVDHEAYDECWNNELRNAPRDVHCGSPDEDHYRTCVCENECSDNWTSWFFDVAGRSVDKCVEQCNSPHLDSNAGAMLLQIRNKMQAQVKNHMSAKQLKLLQTAENHDELDRKCIWSEISEEVDACWGNNDFQKSLPADAFCGWCDQFDVEYKPQCILEHQCTSNWAIDDWDNFNWADYDQCVGPKQNDEQNGDRCLGDVWCEIDNECADAPDHHTCHKKKCRERPAADFCQWATEDWATAEDWKRCIAENECTENWSHDWEKCSNPSPWSDADNVWFDEFQPVHIQECLSKIWNNTVEFQAWIPDGCFDSPAVPEYHDVAASDLADMHPFADGTGAMHASAGSVAPAVPEHHDMAASGTGAMAATQVLSRNQLKSLIQRKRFR